MNPRQVTLWLAVFLLALYATAGRGLANTANDNARQAVPGLVTTTPTATVTVTITATVTITPTATVTPTPTATEPAPGDPHRLYMPLVFNQMSLIGPPLPPPTAVAGVPPIDFPAVSAELREEGYELAFNKIGFHTGWGGNIDGLIDSITELDAAGIPVVLKSVDHAYPLYQAQQLMQASGVPHVLIYRRSGNLYDVPNYNLPPEQAAAEHWQRHIAAFPPELDPQLVWLETINEVDKNRSEWLAEFALATAELALQDGYRWAAFGWSSGEPEPYHWEGPKMLEFLRLVANYPDQLAIALHEYSYTTAAIGDGYPYKLGRFQQLFHIADINGISRPTVLITEWGWEYQNVPPVDEAMVDIAWAAWMYAAYPQIKGAAIWYLGGNFGNIADQVQQLIAPLGDYAQANYFAITPGIGAIDDSLFLPNPPTGQPAGESN